MTECCCFPVIQKPRLHTGPPFSLPPSPTPTLTFSSLHREEKKRGRNETHLTHEHMRGEYSTMLVCLTAAAVVAVAGQM